MFSRLTYEKVIRLFIMFAPKKKLNLYKLLLLAVLAVFAAPAAANAASINLSRFPAPPEAVKNDGAHQVRFNYQIDYTTTAVRRVTRILDGRTVADGVPVAGTQVTTSMAGQPSPFISPTETYTIPAGLPAGRYLVEVRFYSQEFCDNATCTGAADDANYEQRAIVEFGVAAATGDITVRKFEDVNGDGIRQAQEPGIANWAFQVTSPNANLVGTRTDSFATSGAGTFTLSSVPAGPGANYSVSEIIPNPNTAGWAPTTAGGETQTLSLADGATRLLEFGNVRLTQLCGNVWVEKNRSLPQVYDAGADQLLANVPVRLEGTTGTGQSVVRTGQTDANGRYCFTGLYPGTYAVRETVTTGYTAWDDLDGAGNGKDQIAPINLVSGVPSVNNDFSVVEPLPPVVVPEPPVVVPPVVVPPTPQTKLCLTKKGTPKKIYQGQTVTWTITVKNCGTNPALKVSVNDPLLSSTTISNKGGSSLINGELVWATGTLEVGKSRTYKFSTRFDRDARIGKHTNRASASASNAPTVSALDTVQVIKKKRAPKRVAVTG